MTVLSFPGIKVSRITRTLRTAVAGSTSPFTLREQVQDWGGEVWEYEFDVPPQEKRGGAALSAFFNQLGGKRGRFVFIDPALANDATLGSPVVAANAAAGANIIACSGLGGTIYAGQFISVGTLANTRLYQLTQDAVPDIDGLADLHVIPRLRTTLAEDTEIEANTPQVLLRLSGPVPTNISTAQHYTFSIQAREAI